MRRACVRADRAAGSSGPRASDNVLRPGPPGWLQASAPKRRSVIERKDGFITGVAACHDGSGARAQSGHNDRGERTALALLAAHFFTDANSSGCASVKSIQAP